MDKITPEFRDRFLEFRELYEWNSAKLKESGAYGSFAATRVWEATLAAIPLTEEQLRLYKMHVALHSVNGGELFRDGACW